MPEQSAEPVRRSLSVSGTVQGVGFRPFVHALASRHALGGFVRNRSGSVHIEIEGAPEAIDAFTRDMVADAPALAHIHHIISEASRPQGDVAFRIEASERRCDGEPVFVSPDAATCQPCLEELFDPGSRRYRYAFVTCASCGPRYSVVEGVPYDRSRTTMARFVMCAGCRAEYDDPTDRRFHAQTIACPACGPCLRVVDADDHLLSNDPLDYASNTFRRGAILAVKGLGGYHLACLAADTRAVGELRRRKLRDAKPFAVMVSSLRAAEALCELGSEERALLASPAAPIVLCRRHATAAICDEVAPGQARLGVMLAYAPLHHLLLRDLEGAPLVMTSGNRRAEPIAYRDEDARARLGAVADAFLVHDRPIRSRCDDSVMVVVGAEPAASVPVRRSRGLAPAPIRLPFDVDVPTLAMGGHLKSTFAFGHGRNAWVSRHLGDLDEYEALRAYREALGQYRDLLGVSPRRIAFDLHPDYATTLETLALAGNDPVERVAVQHHHAHLASCMADRGLVGPVLGVCFDGFGLGHDGAMWGGEFFVGGYGHVRRAAHLKYVGLPGGERAAREPWRMAVSHLCAAGMSPSASPLATRLVEGELNAVAKLVLRDDLVVPTSSVGRLFDAVASLLGVCDRATFEGQAAMALEALAHTGPSGGYPLEVLSKGETLVVDPAPVIRAVVEDVQRGVGRALIARRFHDGLADTIALVCSRLRDESGIHDVVLSGGVFVNALLCAGTLERLGRRGFRVHVHRTVPPNDGGLSLGQLAVATAIRRKEP